MSGHQSGHEYRATVTWQRQPGEAYTDNRYSRLHQWRFDEGLSVPASSSPLHVPLPMSVAAAVDPEEAFIAALSSCHMLFFLWHAAKKGFVVDSYNDIALGLMGKNARGASAIVSVRLRPLITWGGENKPTDEEVRALHEHSHHDCYLANSVTAEVTIE